jgi:hypothetical protein
VEPDDNAEGRPVHFGGPGDIDSVAEAARRFFGSRFAGDWFAEEGRRRKYFVAAVGLQESEAEAFRQRVDGHTRWLKLVDARYSEADLDRFNDAVAEILAGNTSKAAAWGPSVHSNRLTVTLNPEDSERFRPEIEAAVPADALELKVEDFEIRLL